jgi:hypothetical protein
MTAVLWASVYQLVTRRRARCLSLSPHLSLHLFRIMWLVNPTYVPDLGRIVILARTCVSQLDCGLDDRRITFRFPTGAIDFPFAERQKRLWGPPIPLCNGYRYGKGLSRWWRDRSRVADHLHLMPRLTNAWSMTSTPTHAFTLRTGMCLRHCTIAE